MTYYSQCGEDEYLNTKYFKNMQNGIFLEMGALDGVTHSNTKFFEDTLGWTGILIEPNPVQFEKLVKNRPKCKLYEALVSNIPGEVEFRYFLDELSAVSGVKDTLPPKFLTAWFDNDLFQHNPQASVKMQTRTLTDIVRDSGVDHIDFLSLDVEGHELHVIKSFDFSVPIGLMLIEWNPEKDVELQECDSILRQRGYKCVDEHQASRIYIPSTTPRSFSIQNGFLRCKNDFCSTKRI